MLLAQDFVQGRIQQDKSCRPAGPANLWRVALWCRKMNLRGVSLAPERRDMIAGEHAMHETARQLAALVSKLVNETVYDMTADPDNCERQSAAFPLLAKHLTCCQHT